MNNYFSLMSTRTRIKCMGVILISFASAFLTSIWPMRLGELYTNIANLTINTIVQGAMVAGILGLIDLSVKFICNDVFATVLTAVCTFVSGFLNAPGIMSVSLTITVRLPKMS